MICSPEQAMDPHDLALLEEEWKHLRSSFDKLLNVVEGGYKVSFDNQEWMTIYTKVYDLCTKQRLDATSASPQATEILYQRYQSLMEKYLSERQDGLRQGTSRDALLKNVVVKWTNHKIIVRWMQKLFQYLDRYFTKHNSRDSLRECGLKVFSEVIYQSVKDELRESLFDHIQREREGEVVDRAHLKEAIKLYIEMGMESTSVYQQDFEQPFLAFTADYYEREASRWLSEDSATEYMKKAEIRLAEEVARARAYLHAESEKNLVGKVEDQILAKHQRALLDMEHSGFIALLRDQRLEDISRTYRLFHRIPRGLEPIAQLMREFVTAEGKEVVQKHSGCADLDFKAYTTDLLELHYKYQALLKNQLQSDKTFQRAVKDAFEQFVNAPVQCNVKAGSGMPAAKISSSELISNYCDMLMKNAGEKIGDDELDERFEQLVDLFGYISDKDLFQEFYRKSLSKRLLVTQVSEDAEKAFISKLKMRQGAPYTSRLEGMITDRNLSSELNANFREWQGDRSVNFGFDFTVQVLTTGFWPAFSVHPLEVPENVAAAQEKFRQFYDGRTQSRKLRWIYSLATAAIDANLKKGKYQLQMTCFQACVLLLFNNQEAYTGEEITKILTLPWEEVKKALQSFAAGKYKLLLRSTAGGAAAGEARAAKAMDESDTFSLNEDFADRQRKLKIPTVVAKVNPKSSAQVQQTVEEDRRHAIEACIVRIMKSRKTMEHSLLIGECIQQLSNHFKPDPKHIKKRIEDLIGREYLERDAERPNLYRYLA
eukprot:Hpha_TRINITY_DN13896_c0_g1::TRINITY_DN13896_c0_g1_i1::g.69912::m.69912/K03347/CUL1, CDC53; cullin 1